MVLTRVTSPSPTDTIGALTFRESPNYEMPADADGDNVYEVTVAATDADSNRGEKSVEVKVANVDEDGTVTLSAVQPRVGVSLTASLTDPDGGVSDLKWQWSNGGDNNGRRHVGHVHAGRQRRRRNVGWDPDGNGDLHRRSG